MSTTDSSGNINTAVLVRRSLFFIVLIALTLLQLMVLFRGLSEPKGMDQAQLAREIARGNGFTTKILRPVAIWQSQQASQGEATLLEAARDTYHSPLHPVLLAGVLKAVGGGDSKKWRMGESDSVYKLDRVIAASAVICFLMAIGVNYLLICRIFDSKIAGVTALLMLLCDLNWQFTQSGLPQMLMLLLFSCACFFAYRAVENTEEGGIALMPALVAGLFFALLGLTHWIAVWIILGFVVYAAFFIRPRGVAGLGALVFFVVLSAYFLIKNVEYSNSVGGTAFLALYDGLGGSEDNVMRTYDLGDAYLPLQNLPFKIVRTTLQQADNLYINLGSIFAAPIFFLALLHPFKRASIASFRWGIFIMWLFACLGMAIFGASDRLGSNQLHILFAPLMAAYGLAFLAIIWSKLSFPNTIPQLSNAHFIAVVIVSSGPLVLSLPRTVRAGLSTETQRPHWPPYYPSLLNTRLTELTLKNEIIVSDQPWAVAWYADRTSLWLPKKPAVLDDLERIAEDQGSPIAGVLISPYSYGVRPLYNSHGEYGEYAPLLLDGWAAAALESRRSGVLAMQDESMRALLSRYPYPTRLAGPLLMYWSSEPVFEEQR
jgi:hypothetical protein